MINKLKYVLISILLASSLSASAAWVEGSVVGVRDDNSKAPIAIFINSYTGAGDTDNQWHRIQVSNLGIPADALSVQLSGLLIITHGYAVETCNVTIAFRAPGDTLDADNYIGQTIEAAIGSGQRSNMSTWAPVKNGEIEYQWRRGTYGQWPDHCSYGINLSAQAYVR